MAIQLWLIEGSEHDVAKDQRFQIYTLSNEEIKDPESGESLGRLEIVKGIGEVVHIQPRMATLEIHLRKVLQRNEKL